jgi:hypothetical protein
MSAHLGIEIPQNLRALRGAITNAAFWSAIWEINFASLAPHCNAVDCLYSGV